jgi:hypothetical protein
VTSFGSPSVITASRAVTTEAPHWRLSRRGRDPRRGQALNHAATVTLCSQRKASHFWRIFLLVCAATEHKALGNGCGTRARAKRLRTTNVRLIAATLVRISKDWRISILKCRGRIPRPQPASQFLTRTELGRARNAAIIPPCGVARPREGRLTKASGVHPKWRAQMC